MRALFISLAVLAAVFSVISSACERREKSTQTGLATGTAASGAADRIVLVGGGVIQGKLVEETQDVVRIKWQDGVIGFHPSEIQSIERNASKDQGASLKAGLYVPTFESEAAGEEKWPAGADHRVLLKNGEWVNGRIILKTGHSLTVREQLEGGGAIELDLDLDRVEQIALWPPAADRSQSLKDFLAKHPSLKLIRKDYHTILTSEQDPIDLKLYLKTLDQFYHDFLLYFFELIDRDQKPEPLDVIIFGTRKEFSDALAEIGYHEKGNPAGFYNFNAKKLVFYNMKTDRDVQAGLQKSRQFQSEMTKLSSEVNAQYGENAGRIQGEIERASGEAEREELRITGEARSQNVRIIRHEGAHQLFHLLGITPAEVYIGGWLIEGLAVYCEPDRIGDVHEEKLMHLRFELEKNELMPLEYLLNFARGTDFHKLDPRYANVAYAESWAFIYFLMHQGHRESLFNYLSEMRRQGKDFDAKGERELLEKHLGKDLKAIEREFFPFVKKLIAESIDEKTYQDYRLRLIQAS